MNAGHYAWLTAAGLCTVLAPGTPLWVLPLVGFGAQVAYELDPSGTQERARALLAQTHQRLQLLSPDAPTGLLPRRQQANTPGNPAQPTQTAPTAQPSEDNPLVETLEATPHRLIIGHTRGGKTTLIHHLATSWAQRGERVMVADPDAAPGLWPGCEVRGAGDDIASIGELLQIVAGEVEQRRQLRAQGVRRFEPLHLVVDEAQDVLPVIEGGLELFETIARRGGKLNVRMTVGVQDKQVKTLGLEGKSEVLRNLQVADVLKNRQGQRVAVLRDAETGQKVSIPIPELLDPESLIVAPPAPASQAAPAAVQLAPNVQQQSQGQPASAPLDLSDLLNDLLAVPVPAASGSAGNEPAVPVSATTDGGNGNGNTASVTVTGAGGNTATVRIYAQAVATGRGPARRGRGLDMRARRARAVAQRQNDELARAYAEARASGVKSFRQAYAQLKGNRDKALAAWQAAAPTQ